MKIVIFSEIAWSFLKQRHHFVTELFLERKYDVVFIERVYSRIPSIKEFALKLMQRIRGRKSNSPEKIPNGLKIEKSLFLPNVNFIFYKINYIIGIYYSKKHSDADVVYTFNNNPNTVNCFNKSIKIFDIVHNWWMYKEHNKWQNYNVKQTIEDVDIVIVDTSKLISKVESEKFNVKTLHIPPGVSDDWLIRRKINNNNSEPRGIFFGNLRSNSDIELILKLIADGFYIDLYGIIDSSIDSKYKKKLDMKFKGRLSNKGIMDIIPDYNFVLLPYAKNDFSSTIAPAKYFECLATGLVLVSNSQLNHLPGWTKFVIEYYGDKKEFRDRIINDRDELSEQQKDLAKKYTWKNNFSQLFEYIEKK
jgi:hypothetical protein